MAGSADQGYTPAEVGPGFFQPLSNPDSLLLVLEGANHYSFASVCVVPSLKPVPTFECDGVALEPRRGYALIATATTAFLGLHLKQDERYREWFEAACLATVPEVSVTGK
jgi:predicted dienelactone hydrolase